MVTLVNPSPASNTAFELPSAKIRPASSAGTAWPENVITVGDAAALSRCTSANGPRELVASEIITLTATESPGHRSPSGKPSASATSLSALCGTRFELLNDACSRLRIKVPV